jgi:YidC/Oxa1 family membrane protein insertase
MTASIIGQLAHPFYEAFAWVLAAAYQLIPNYAVAIAILTIVVMIVCFPITLRGTRGMLKMQALAPEMKRLQAKYKASPGLGAAERTDLRQRQQAELMALYRQNDVSPVGGFLPLLIQMPIFLILYQTVRGLTHTVNGNPVPLYVSHASRLYAAVVNAHGHLNAFGINLANSVRTSGSLVEKLPIVAMVLVAVALQYVQMKQLSGRNPQGSQANPQAQQMQKMQKIFPVFFALIYISIPAGVNVYFIISAAFRICQQELMYRRDPHIRSTLERLRGRTDPGLSPG